jgi:hypothetical protein
MFSLHWTVVVLGWAVAWCAVDVTPPGNGRCGGAVDLGGDASCHVGGLLPEDGGEDGAAMVERMAISSLQSSLAVQWRGGPAGGLAKRTPRASDPDPHIPDVIYMAGPWLPEYVVTESLPFVPDGTEFRYYNYDQVDKSAARISAKLESLGVFGVYAAMSQLRPWAFRIDLWRFLVLWETGGYYLDAKLILRQNLSMWVGSNNGGKFVACSISLLPTKLMTLQIESERSPPTIQNCALAASPRDPLLLSMIRKLVGNVESRWYGPPPSEGPPWIYITGPGLLQLVIEEAGFKLRTHCEFVEEESVDRGERVDGRIQLEGSGPTLMVESHKVHQDMRNCSTCNSYQDLWSAHALYCDEYVPPGYGDDPCAADYFNSTSYHDPWLSMIK